MKQRVFGSTGVEVGVIGQGTWQMEHDDRRAAIEALRRGIDAGMTHIDTAEMYGSGRVEELVGEAIAGRRDGLFIASKVLPHNASYEGTLRACERSLDRLGIDALDLYMLHWPGSHPLEQTIRAFETLVAQGKIRSWGLSNFDVDELQRALAIAGPGRIACDQVLYHLGARYAEHELAGWCREHDVALVGYSPFGSGRFPERGTGGRVLAEIAQARQATPHQVALAFLVRLDGTFAIPKASRADHALDNAGGAQLELSDEELARLEAVFPAGDRRAGLPVL